MAQSPVEGIGSEIAATPAEPTPGAPGGKALLRLLAILSREGLSEVALGAVVNAVSADRTGEVLELVAPQVGATLAPTKGTPRKAGSRARAKVESAPVGVGTAEAYAEAWSDAVHRLGPPTGTGPQWRSLGPWTVTNGQTYGSSRVNVSGRVSALAIDPGNANHVLAGAANGGVWESRDGGASWAPRTDFQATLTVGALAFDPVAPATVYCGTGEGDWWSWLGNGLLRSTDGGTTWTSRCTTPFVGQGFYSLVVDRSNPDRLFAGTNGGLYVSGDGGATWTQRRNAQTWSISANAAGTEVLAGCSDGVFASSDSGTTWTAVALPSPPASIQRIAVAVAPSNSNVAWAWAADSAGGTHLWRRTLAGRPRARRWTYHGSPPGSSGGQGWYDWYVAAAPDLSNEVYCGAIELHRGTLSGGTWTWLNLSNKGTTGDSIHPDQHSIAFAPGAPATVYAGNDGGVFRSNDRGVTWQHCNNGLVISEYEYIAHDIGSSRWLIGGTQDNGTNRYTGSSTWQHVQDGDGGDCASNRTNSRTVFHTFQNGFAERSTTGGDWASWANITPPRPAGEAAGLFYVPFEASASTGNTVGLGGQALYVSRNDGTTWTRLGYPTAGTASALHIPDADTVLVGLTDGRILRTRFAGGAWGALTALTTPRAGAYVSDVQATTGGGARIWAAIATTGGGRVFRSDDGGATWTDRSAGLPNLPLNAVAVDDGNPNRVWVAADVGVYQSLDAGVTWTDYANGLPNAFVGDLIFHPHARVLRAGTRNRGVWEIPVDGWTTQPACGVQFTGTLGANSSGRWFTWGWPATWHVVWTVMPTTNTPGGPQVSWVTQVERASSEFATYWITVRNLTAQPVNFEGRFGILSRY